MGRLAGGDGAPASVGDRGGPGRRAESTNHRWAGQTDYVLYFSLSQACNETLKRDISGPSEK